MVESSAPPVRMAHRRVNGPRPHIPGPATRLEDSVKLADMTPPDAPQEGAQSGGCFVIKQSSTSAVLPVRNTLASSMQSPPAQLAEATRVTSLSPGFFRPWAPPSSTFLLTSIWQHQSHGEMLPGSSSPALATRR